MRLSVLACALGACIAVGLAVPAFAAITPPNVRPQPVEGTLLQDHFSRLGEAIDVVADQCNACSWTFASGASTTLTLTLVLGGTPAAQSIGLYDVARPESEREIFPAIAGNGWTARIAIDHWDPGLLRIEVFDVHGDRYSVRYADTEDLETFGFYVHPTPTAGSAKCFHTEDHENGCLPGGTLVPQALVYPAAVHGDDAWWVAFQETSTTAKPHSFADILVLVQRDTVTPVPRTTWGAIKSIFAH